jgi:hypothetical protein
MEHRHDTDDHRETPFLRDLKGRDPFVVPEGFFERFPLEVQEHIAARSGSRHRFARSFQGPLFRWSLAGGAIAVLAVVLVTMLAREQDDVQEFPAVVLNVEPDEIELDAWDDTDLLTTMADEPALVASVGQELDTDLLLHYLENEVIPLDLLSEEL